MENVFSLCLPRTLNSSSFSAYSLSFFMSLPQIRVCYLFFFSWRKKKSFQINSLDAEISYSPIVLDKLKWMGYLQTEWISLILCEKLRTLNSTYSGIYNFFLNEYFFIKISIHAFIIFKKWLTKELRILINIDCLWQTDVQRCFCYCSISSNTRQLC